MLRLENYVGGKPVAPRSGRYADIVDPSTGEVFVQAPLSGPDDVDDAFAAAQQAFTSWRVSTPGERSLLLFRIADALEAHREQIVEAECRNTGKPVAFMRDAEFPEHARVLTGGHADRTGGGFFFQPTVVAGVRQDDEIVQEEVFGPVITVQPFSSEAEAVRLANDVRFGLAAGLWTTDHDRVLRVSAQLEFGKVWVNCHLVVAAEMPNSGYKHSGHGNDPSVLAIEEYTRVKHVMSAVRP